MDSTEFVIPDPPVRELISEAAIQQRVVEMAAQIDRDLAAVDRLVAIGVLKGAVFFLTDLLKHVRRPVEVDFLQASSYGDSTVPGEVQLTRDIGVPIRGAHVLVVEDIIDTGNTLSTILEHVAFRGAAAVHLCALLDKPSRREVEVEVHYRGFEIEDQFVVGYGLDFAERYRNLPYVGIYEGPT
ncbi:MAG: hypoxanthine phosphoribosyltransferase [Acidobacteriota bacterium]